MKDIKEIIIGKPLDITHGVSTLPQMIFRDIPGRSDIDQIIVGHIGNRIITLNLEELRSLVLFMQPFFEAKQINKGATVMLISLPGSTEIMTAVYAIALACRGVRVCMPMQTSKEELGEWVALTQATHAILPSREINDLEGHELEKNHLEAIVHILREKNVEVWDSVMSFPLYHAMISGTYHTLSHSPWENVLPPVSPFDEALILTTSGSTGKSRLVVYEHISFALGCMAWSQAGLYEDHRMGGASFTPQVAHSMGVMGIMNAIWSGKPACLISVDMFFTDPVTAVELLLSMNPKVITGGPGVFKIFKGVLETFPEARDTLLANDKVFVNCDAELDPVLGKTLHHSIWNAFNSTETMMALTTMLQTHAKKGSLGAPLPGISISLREADKGGMG